MVLYAERPGMRVMQIAGDIGLVVWCWMSLRVARGVQDLIGRLAAPGRAIEDAGGRFAGSLERASEVAGEVPLAGDLLRAPFVAIADAGRDLESAGRTQQAAVETMAFWFALGVGLLLAMLIISRYVPWRVRLVRDASAARRLREHDAGIRILAYRAAATRRLDVLARAVEAPSGVPPDEWRALAALELEALGLESSAGAAAS